MKMNYGVKTRIGSKGRLTRTIAGAAAVLTVMAGSIVPAIGSSAATTKQVTIGIAAITEASPNVLQQLAMDKVAAKLLGFKVVVLNANGDPTQMSEIMSSLVNQNVNGIIDIAINSANAPQAFAQAKAKGIPIIAQAAPLIGVQPAATYAPSDAKMSSLLAKQILTDYPDGGQALSLNASSILAIVIRYQTIAKDTSGIVTVAATHETDLANAIADTQTAVTDALQANPKINMVWGLQDFEFSTSLQTIQADKLGNVGVFSYYLDPVDFGILRADKAAGNTQPEAVADSPVYDSGWYAFASFANKFLLHKKKWVVSESIHPFPYTLITPDNVQATGDVYNYPSYQPFFVKLWKSEGIKIHS
jgi:ABC-type sugar transport system substrate-binding protein